MSLRIIAVQVGGNGVIFSDERSKPFLIPDVFQAGNGEALTHDDVDGRLQIRAWMDPKEFRQKNRVNLEIWHSNTGPIKGAMMQMLADLDSTRRKSSQPEQVLATAGA